MNHWTSIPFYLWKNTFKRWLENPFPALVKIVIPALLATLGVVVLAMFAQIERELEYQLKKASALRVHISEYVSADKADSMLLRSDADEIMWASRVGADNVRFTTQVLSSARLVNVKRSRPIPVYSMPAQGAQGVGEFDPQDIPVIELLDAKKGFYGTDLIEINGMKVRATTGTMPDWMDELTNATQVVMVPADMAYPMKRKGYIHHMIVNLSSIDEVEKFVEEVKAYTRADRRQITVTSAMGILRQLERIQGIQNVVRRLLVGGCCLILAMTLGSIAWLEYRQDSYLLALLRSFGTPSAILFLHAFVENLLLVLLGIMPVLMFWKPLYGLITENISVVGFQVAGAPSLPQQDVLLIIMGGLLGVALAMLPIAMGLRKPPGHTLQ